VENIPKTLGYPKLDIKSQIEQKVGNPRKLENIRKMT